MKHLKLSILVLSIMLISTISSAQSATVYGDPPEDNRPTLQIQKWISNDALLIGESVTVNVNISNWSEGFAYNLSITEPAFSSLTVKRIQGYDRYIYDGFGPGASVSYNYTILPENEGNYTIEPTEIVFYDENSTRHFGRSAHIPFFVYEVLPPRIK